jgi:uncharacterized protein (TIGR03083 family)
MATTVERTDRLIEKLDAAWHDFQDTYAGLTDEEVLEPGVVGEWSIRDLIAHVTWWEEEALSHLPTILAGGRPVRYSVAYGGIDAFNARRTEQRRELSLDEVRAAFVATHRRLVDYLRGVPPEELKGDSRFRRRLRLDTYGHYPIHAADIRAWRERGGAGGSGDR